MDKLGGLTALGGPSMDYMDNMDPAGWARAGSTPLQATKLVASYFGGTGIPVVILWPDKIAPDKRPRSQFHHVNDLAPTIYEVLGIIPPREVNGAPQDPIDGVSMQCSFDAPDAKCEKRKDWNLELAPKQAENGVAATSNDIRGFVCNSDSMAGGVIALEQKRFAGRVFVTGQDAAAEGCR